MPIMSTLRFQRNNSLHMWQAYQTRPGNVTTYQSSSWNSQSTLLPYVCGYCMSEMGFVLIRHSDVELRRVNMDRVPKIVCVCRWDCRKDRWGRWDRTCACGQCQVRQGMTRGWHHKDVQFQLLSHACSSAEMWSICSVCVVTVRIFTCCLGGSSVHTLRRLSGFLQANRNLSNSVNFCHTLECWEFQVLISKWVRSKFDDDDEAVPRSRVLPCPQMLVLFAVLVVVLSCWVLARCSSCNRSHSLFAWAKSGRWLTGCWGPSLFSVMFRTLNSLSSCCDVEMFLPSNSFT